MPFLKTVILELMWITFVVLRKLKIRILVLKRLFVRPQLPKNPEGKVLIHLGCGDIASPEFINVDARPAPHVHYVRDVCDLSIFPDNHADLVYASHLLEHVRHNALRKTLWEWRRILKPDGVLRLSVPDFDVLLDIYEACGHDIDSIAAPLMGGQDYAENIHYSVFNSKYLSRLLIEVGFRSVREWDPQKVDYHNFEDWASKTIEKGGKKYRVSLNLEAVK
jgi:SAM-dependent methyltransferase